MRKIIVGAQVSIDGIMQAPGAASEDPTSGFDLGGWAMPYFDKTFGDEIMHVLSDYDLLLGRKTYEIFAAYWPYYDETGEDGQIARDFRKVTKYVVSRSGEVDTSWAGSVLLRDVDEVKKLKEGDGPKLVTQGSTELAHALLAADLVDGISIFTIPVVLGKGKRLFADGSAPHAFKLSSSAISPNGLVVTHYERDGAVKIGDTSLDKPSDRELVRRKRVKREG